MENKFYITTTLPYVNASPHIGFAAEIIKADTIARYKRQKNYAVFFNTGTDEHGLKIYRKAAEENKTPQEYCDEYAAKFNDLKNALNLSYDNFIRTTDEKHIEGAQEFWQKCFDHGDIYKKNYKAKYCVGCESEKTDSELVNDCCPLHPNQKLEIIEEENYFFRFSLYAEKLLKLYNDSPDFVVPAHRLNEIKKFVEGGLQDFSISRLASKMPWGIPVPGDPSQNMYVWFDALTNYVNALDWSKNGAKFKEFWPGTQVCGKDNLRFQAAMWQAMLMSAGLSNSKQVLVFGFITVDGQKMSKSLGNVISPYDLVQKYGTDATRYYLLSEILPFEDGDFSYDKFNARYSADLANGLGNLVSRVSNLLEKNEIKTSLQPGTDSELINTIDEKMNKYEFNEALKVLWDNFRSADEQITAKAPWKMTEKTEIENVLKPIAQSILNNAELLKPFMPEAAEKIVKQFSEEQIKKGEGLFPRLSS